MSSRPRVAVSWAGACGGCDVALLDSEHRLLDLAELVEIVYWPVAMDWKRDDLVRYGSGEIDIGIFNGAIRTAEHSADAELLRDRCRVLVAFGACAAFGGIPGLANLHPNQELLDTVYRDTPSTHNPTGTIPQPSTEGAGGGLELPALEPQALVLHEGPALAPRAESVVLERDHDGRARGGLPERGPQPLHDA